MTGRSRRATPYDDRFYDTYVDGIALSSARAVIPLLLELLGPRSVLDVGCGRGVWLSVFAELGIDDYLGIDGNWVSAEHLVIPHEKFRAQDLTSPGVLDRRFDLAVSLEVAEHLPETAASSFVELLTTASDSILFSAAVPGQGGTGHVNEQWPAYWVGLFATRGYQVLDCIRWRVWNDEAVAPCYAQNMFLAMRPEAIDRVPELVKWATERPDFVGDVRPLVHPSLAADLGLPPEQRYSPVDLVRALIRRTGMSVRARAKVLRRGG